MFTKWGKHERKTPKEGLNKILMLIKTTNDFKMNYCLNESDKKVFDGNRHEQILSINTSEVFNFKFKKLFPDCFYI